MVKSSDGSREEMARKFFSVNWRGVVDAFCSPFSDFTRAFIVEIDIKITNSDN